MSDIKCVIVVDKELPLGLIANTAAILGCSLGRYAEEVVGHAVTDKNNYVHKGIINTPVPILASTRNEIKKLYATAFEKYNDKIMLIDFNLTAQQCNDYSNYTEKISATASDDLDYLGICMYGNKKAINSLVGSLPTLK